ncbi:MAG: T9SS type A sorting domain-containing protein [Bacteroidales bacterium]|nr:T9SS type A sorting domain-containing protein [Bacteroidales bacterium]
MRANVLPDSNAGTVTGLGTFRSGYNVTLEAHAAAEYKFKEWSFYGILKSTDSIYTFAVDRNQTLSAIFEKIPVSIENIAGVENDVECFNIFPNPVNDRLTIKSKKNNFKATIFNDKGQMVFMRKFYNEKNAALDVAHLSKGIYFIVLDNQTTKFIKL